MRPASSVGSRRKGLTPIIAVVVLSAMVIAMALSAMMFLQGQQEQIGQQLEDALEEEIIIEETVCNGDEARFYISNQGEQQLNRGTATVVVFDGGNINYSFTDGTQVTFEGPFQQPGGSGYLNVTTNAVFRSGDRYTIQMDFGTFMVNRRCTAGQPWWDLGWNWRRQIIVTNPDGSEQTDAATSIQINTTEAIREGRMNPDCSDIRIVEDGTVRDHELSACNDPSSMEEITFPNTVEASSTEYDTYLYYGNLRADDASTTVTGTSPLTTRLMPVEEQ